MEGHDEFGLLGEHFDPIAMGRNRDDEYESRSGSDNLDGASGDDQDGGATGGDQPPRKKKYHRHTPQQIQELEAFFKEYPHPDEKQRMELSRRLRLESKQIKFWFQNRRTQMKTQVERHENMILRQENDRLRAENVAMKNAMSSPICNNCGGPGILGDISYEEHQLRIENARLKEEVSRICSLANKFLGRPLSSLPSPMSLPSSTSGLELAVGRNEFGGFSALGTTLPMGLDLGDGVSSTSLAPLVKPEMPIERSAFLEIGVAAMDDLIKKAQAEAPLWARRMDGGGNEVFNHEEYLRTCSPCFGVKPSGFVSEASRDNGAVIINSLALVETLMDANRWAEMFPCLVARASTIDVVSNGIGGTKNGALLLMHAELRVLSPLVPVRQMKFLRFCKQHAEGVWAVVDVSIDHVLEGSNAHLYGNCRRLPSGCIMQDMPNGYSKVTWVEHSDFDEGSVHHLYRPLISSGIGFGAQRWVATLQRHCECLAILMSSTISGEDQAAISPNGRRSMLKLAQRMTDNFCSGVCASTVRKWDKLHVDNVGEDVMVMTRKSMDDPGEPPGVVLSASTSVWMPISQQRLFDFLRDEELRSEWDILSNGGPMQEMVHIAKGQGHGNCVSLLRANAANGNDGGMLILQETWTDASGSLVVYAPVDIPSMSLVMNGGDSVYVALLPSGFSVLPCSQSSYGGPNNNNGNGNSTKGGSDGINNNGGSLLTVGFQILVSSLPTAKLTVESVETVNNLISCTIQKIKSALQLS